MKLCFEVFIKITVNEIFAIGQTGIFCNQMDDVRTIHLVMVDLHSKAKQVPFVQIYPIIRPDQNHA